MSQKEAKPLHKQKQRVKMVSRAWAYESLFWKKVFMWETPHLQGNQVLFHL